MSEVLCNAGPLIALGKLNRLELLAALYSAVSMPTAVYDEVVTAGLRRGDNDARLIRRFWEQQSWPVISVPQEVIAQYQPAVLLDEGEVAVLAWAQTLRDPLVLMDDETARDEARRLGLRVQGTLGILVQAYRRSVLTYLQTELLILELAARPDVWISAQLCQQVLAGLQQADESKP